MLKQLNLKSKTFVEELIKYMLIYDYFGVSIPYRIFLKRIMKNERLWARRTEIVFLLSLYEFTFFFNEKYDKLVKIFGEDIKNLKNINSLMSKFLKDYHKNSEFMSDDGITLIQHSAVKHVYHKALHNSKKLLKKENSDVIKLTRQILYIYLSTSLKGKITRECIAKIKNANKIKDQLNDLLSIEVKYEILSYIENKLACKFNYMSSVHRKLFYIAIIIKKIAAFDLQNLLHSGKKSNKELDKLINEIKNDIYNQCEYSLVKRVFDKLKNFDYSYEDDLSNWDKKRAIKGKNEATKDFAKVEKHPDDEDFEYEVDEDEDEDEKDYTDDEFNDDDSDYEDEES